LRNRKKVKRTKREIVTDEWVRNEEKDGVNKQEKEME
jgi:hypothetical protein